jgi:hypothetical protein
VIDKSWEKTVKDNCRSIYSNRPGGDQLGSSCWNLGHGSPSRTRYKAVAEGRLSAAQVSNNLLVYEFGCMYKPLL